MARSIARNCLECGVRNEGGFCSLADEALRRLSGTGDATRILAGTRFLSEGFQSDKVFILCRGQAKLTVTSADGRVLILRVAVPGDVLGMAAVLRGASYESTAEAIEDCEVKVMPRAAFFHFMKEFEEVGRNSAKAMAEEYRSAVLSARRLALSGSAAGKLASVLVEWGHKASRNPEELRFRMPLTHEELGSMAGIARETVTRLLTRFKSEGLIAVEDSVVVIRDKVGLERLFS